MFNIVKDLNHETLLLRNIEGILINNGIICEECLPSFREDTSDFLLNLINAYIEDKNKKSMTRMQGYYINDSIHFRTISCDNERTCNHNH
jgi:hypothetical protein